MQSIVTYLNNLKLKEINSMHTIPCSYVLTCANLYFRNYIQSAANCINSVTMGKLYHEG